MVYNFLADDRDQLMLMPPSGADWLPEDHLAWFVLDIVAELDLSAFGERIGWMVVVAPPTTRHCCSLC